MIHGATEQGWPTVTEDSKETWQGGGNTEPYLAPELIKPTIRA